MHNQRQPFLHASPHVGRRLTVSAGLAALVGVPAVCLGLRANAQPQSSGQPLHRTPAQTEGPFYPVALPRDADADLLRNGARSPYGQGDPAWVAGQVSDLAGRALAGAQVEIWQCDHAGHYHHPGDGDRASADFQGFGRVRVDADGRYRFRTIRPV